jgi:uncharacterized delta-60 repeat protein
MSFSISNTSASAVITDITTPSSVTGELTVTSGSLPLSAGGMVSGTNTTLDNQKGSPYGTFQMFLKQGDAQIDTYVNNTLYSSEKYSSGIVSVQTPIIQSGDSLTMAVSDPDFDCYSIGAAFAGGTTEPEVIKQQPDGKLLIGGYFTSYQGVSANRIVRLNTDFSIDDTFDYGTGFNGAVNAIAIQSDGKVLVGGNFTTYKGTSRNRIVRLNTDGSLDNTFSIGTGFNNTVWAIVIQPDNKILVGGVFTSYSGVSESRIIRLNTDGSNDTTFSTPTVNNTIFDISIQTDGKILACGDFTQVSGSSNYNRIVRFSTGGTVDETFITGTFSGGQFNSGGYVVVAQPDGKIIFGGDFGVVSGVSSSKIVRLLSNGTRDTSFSVGSGFTQNGASTTAFLVDITLTQNGKYLVSGAFDTYSGNSVSVLARLNSDGSFDSTLNQGTGFVYDDVNGFSFPSTVLSDGNIVIGGLLSGYDGATTGTLVALDPFGKLLNCE